LGCLFEKQQLATSQISSLQLTRMGGGGVTLFQESAIGAMVLLLVEHYVDRSQIDGLGVFSTHTIEKGTLIWRYDPIVDRKIPWNEFLKLSHSAQQWITHHAEFIPSKNLFVLAADGDLFMNHSFDPNLFSDDDDGYAKRNIAIGEEITCDYRYCKMLAFELSPSILETLVTEGAAK
jgi:uncharacterized protein